MCRYVLIALVVAVVVLMAVAVLVVSMYGWPGFLVLVAGLFLLAFGLKKAFPHIVPRLFMGAVTRPMRQMGKVLRGATLTVHSVTPCDPPPVMEDEDADADEPERIADRDDGEDDDDADASDYDEPNPRDLDWYQVDFTLTPRDAGSSEGRVVHRTAWSPGLLGFNLTAADRPPRPVGMPALFDQFLPEVLTGGLEMWTGTGFAEPDDEREVFGEARFRARIGVARNVWTVILTYAHFTPIGEIRIPRIDVTPGREP